jgi:hypothetical protein
MSERGQRHESALVRHYVLVLRKMLLVATVVLVFAAGAQAIRIHAQDGRWALVPSTTPERLHFAGRDYDRVRSVAQRDGLVKDGKTSGGGTIYTIAADEGTDVVIYVRDGDQLWEYSLVGGP